MKIEIHFLYLGRGLCFLGNFLFLFLLLVSFPLLSFSLSVSVSLQTIQLYTHVFSRDAFVSQSCGSISLSLAQSELVSLLNF